MTNDESMMNDKGMTNLDACHDLLLTLQPVNALTI